MVPLLQESFSVNCHVTPWPAGAFVHWILNDRMFVPRTGLISRGDYSERIVNEKATEQLIGNWTCVVGYKGKVVRASAALSLRGEMLKKKCPQNSDIIENRAVAHQLS